MSYDKNKVKMPYNGGHGWGNEGELVDLLIRLYYATDSKGNDFADRTYEAIEDFFANNYKGEMLKYLHDSDTVANKWKNLTKERI